VSRDNLYATLLSQIGDFRFDEQVVNVFPDMIARSVPGYGSMLAVIGQLTERFVQPDTTVWDLGCSLGAATRQICERAPESVTVHAVDQSAAMVDGITRNSQEWCSLQIHQQDLRLVTIADASLVVLNLTLQFIPPDQRTAVISGIANGLRSGGALLLSEKICFEQQSTQELMSGLHHDFKRANGYSDLEIARKRTAIENMLVPESLQTHCQRLRDAGFCQVIPWFQCFNFCSILAIR
jgi:tRNA (cmo5U34)-methyltransferase